MITRFKRYSPECDICHEEINSIRCYKFEDVMYVCPACMEDQIKKLDANLQDWVKELLDNEYREMTPIIEEPIPDYY